MSLSKKTIKKQQQGLVLLALVIVLVLAISTYYFTSISVVETKIDNLEKTRLALKQAKQSLIDYAVLHADGAGSGDPGEYGYLPCPHTAITSPPAEGVQNGTCGGENKNAMGYLPWKSLNSGVLRDGSGNCLWYVVSGSYKNNTVSGLINEDTKGMLQVVDSAGNVIKGNVAEDRVVAIIFSPGVAIGAQSRAFDATTNCGDDPNPSAYLDSVGGTNNAALNVGTDKVDKFIHATLTSASANVPYNDNFITISRDEIWSSILRRSDFVNKMTALTKSLAECLAKYAGVNLKNRLPWPAPVDLDDYRKNSEYDDATAYTGRFPFIVDDSNVAITVGANDELFDQGACNIAGGFSVDLIYAGAPASESRSLWNNWKDHFFYIVSKNFAPASASVPVSCGGDCITVNGNEVAAAVIYSGSPQAGVRNEDKVSGDTDTKMNINNYIDAPNQAAFFAGTGNGVYSVGGNNIMFCIKTDLTVSAC